MPDLHEWKFCWLQTYISLPLTIQTRVVKFYATSAQGMIVKQNNTLNFEAWLNHGQGSTPSPPSPDARQNFHFILSLYTFVRKYTTFNHAHYGS